MEEILLFVVIGFLAQLVDGAVGMAYGLFSTSMMMSLGIPPATASASVHVAEVFTTAASGAAHWRQKNIDFALVKRLAPAGMVGGFLGAYVLASHASEWLRIGVAAYLAGMGCFIIYRAVTKMRTKEIDLKKVPPLGLIGGFFDAIGGGGWGPMVTTSLVGQGANPRKAIGSVSISEFFVATTISTTFMFTIGLDLWPIITGLVIGGVIAAPLAAYTTKKLPLRALMLLVGVVIIGLSLRTILKALAIW